MRNGANIKAVQTLKMVLSIALANTGSWSISMMSQVSLISCRKKMIPIMAEITLNNTWATLSCLLETAPPSEAMTPVIVVPILDHITIAIDAGKVISPPASAAKVMTDIAELDCITSVTTTHIKPNHRRDMSLYAARSKLSLSVSTLSFINHIPMKSNPNHTSNFPIRFTFSLLPPNNIINHPTAMIGKANDEILNSPNHR